MKQQVKLVLAKSFVENPTHSDCFSETVSVELPAHIDQARLISACAYATDSNTVIGGNITATVWDYSDESHFVGKLLTYIDATFSDKEQRQAHKDIVKDIAYGYFQALRERAQQTVDAFTDK